MRHSNEDPAPRKAGGALYSEKGGRLLRLCGKQTRPRHRREASPTPAALGKIIMTSKGDLWYAVSVVILIRTDTTLDQSQKAEKVRCLDVGPKECALRAGETGPRTKHGNLPL